MSISSGGAEEPSGRVSLTLRVQGQGKKAAQRTWPEDSCQKLRTGSWGQARVCRVLDKCDVAFMGELGNYFFGQSAPSSDI